MTKYYSTHREAMNNQKSGDVIQLDPEKGFYITTPIKRKNVFSVNDTMDWREFEKRHKKIFSFSSSPETLEEAIFGLHLRVKKLEQKNDEK